MGANVILVGFMGAGKSSVGRLLARRLGRCFIETDDMITAREGRSIPEIFAVLIPQLTRLVDGIEVHGGTWLRAEPLPLVSGEEWPDFHHST